MDSSERAAFPYVVPPELRGAGRRHRTVVVVGAGPVGLTAALDLARHGIEAVLVDESDTVSDGSRAICWAKRTLEVWDRLGVAEPMLELGVTWNDGRVFLRDEELYAFSLRDEGEQKHPAFINLQQHICETRLVDAVSHTGSVELRWRNRVTGLEHRADGVTVTVETPDGDYRLDCDWLIAADGARSTVRRLMGLSFQGKVFDDRFLIADVVMKADFPRERWFWFDPPFNPGQSALLHMQPQGVWRIDLQLGADADPEVERRPERVIPRIRRMLGEDVPFELQWTSVYTFQCRMLERFRHDRVLFVGDAAHQVSPFGARGANSGIQDVDNLVWKLALVTAGTAPESLLDSYDAERREAARENMLASTRSTDFITPKGGGSRVLRDATLALAREWSFARALVNSGRLSRPTRYRESPLIAATDLPADDAVPGAPCPNAPVTRVTDGGRGWLLDHLGDSFAVVAYGRSIPPPLSSQVVPVRVIAIGPPTGGTDADLSDDIGHVAQALGLEPGGTLLVRPDQHIAARWRHVDSAGITAALRKAAGLAGEDAHATVRAS